MRVKRSAKLGVNQTGWAFALLAMVVLTGCSFMDEEPLDLSHDGQAEKVDGFNNKLKDDNAENADKSVDPQHSQEALNNQADADNADPASLKQTVYFLDDSNEVEPGFIPLIEKQSQELLDNPEQTLVLEGHADERGSREYNLALGEERAKAVAKMMQARGVRASQLEIVSYGEEKPATPEQGETAWHLNRRVNLISQRTQK